MRATSTRRLLVFVVCACGVAALHLFPGIARGPVRVGASSDPVRRDRTRPASVATISADRVTRESITLHWNPTRDDVGVVSYRVWLNGFPVASTTETRATVEWFNDDSTAHLLQVRALDAAGNESDSSLSLLLERPTSDPVPSDRATSIPVQHAADHPSPSATPITFSTPGDTE